MSALDDPDQNGQNGFNATGVYVWRQIQRSVTQHFRFQVLFDVSIVCAEQQCGPEDTVSRGKSSLS